MSENSIQYENLENVSDYVEKNYKIWEEAFYIPYEEEFNIKLLLQLRYDILTTKPEYTRTKFDLIEMSNRIQSRLKLKSKQKEEKSKHNYIILIIGNIHQLDLFIKLIEMIANKDEYKQYNERKCNGTPIYEIEFFNGVRMIFRSKDTIIKNLIIDNYINLTGDFEFEQNILKPMLEGNKR